MELRNTKGLKIFVIWPKQQLQQNNFEWEISVFKNVNPHLGLLLEFSPNSWSLQFSNFKLFFFCHYNFEKPGPFNTFPKTWSLWHNLVVLHFSKILFSIYTGLSKNKQVWLDFSNVALQDFLKNMGLILNLIQGHLTILRLKKEAVWLQVKEIICNQLIWNKNSVRSFLFS